MAHWLANPVRQTQYLVVSQLGQGGYGSVFAGRSASGIDVAIKIVKPTGNVQRDFGTWFIDQHVHLLCLGHQHIVATYDQFVSPEGNLVIVMERGGGSLDSLLVQGRKWSNKDICAVGSQILSALGEIHANGVAHRDVTLKNIIWFPNGIFKLCDFGISKPNLKPGEYARTLIGTPIYYPPELLMNGYTTHQSDIYQLGLVLLTLMMGRHPIPVNLPPQQIRQLIMQGFPRQCAESLISSRGATAQILARMLPRHEQYRFQTTAHAEAALTSEFWTLERQDQAMTQFRLGHL